MTCSQVSRKRCDSIHSGSREVPCRSERATFRTTQANEISKALVLEPPKSGKGFRQYVECIPLRLDGKVGAIGVG